MVRESAVTQSGGGSEGRRDRRGETERRRRQTAGGGGTELHQAAAGSMASRGSGGGGRWVQPPKQGKSRRVDAHARMSPSSQPNKAGAESTPGYCELACGWDDVLLLCFVHSFPGFPQCSHFSSSSFPLEYLALDGCAKDDQGGRDGSSGVTANATHMCMTFYNNNIRKCISWHAQELGDPSETSEQRQSYPFLQCLGTLSPLQNPPLRTSSRPPP